MQYYRTFAKQTDVNLHLKNDFIYDHCDVALYCGDLRWVNSELSLTVSFNPVAGLLLQSFIWGSHLVQGRSYSCIRHLLLSLVIH